MSISHAEVNVWRTSESRSWSSNTYFLILPHELADDKAASGDTNPMHARGFRNDHTVAQGKQICPRLVMLPTVRIRSDTEVPAVVGAESQGLRRSVIEFVSYAQEPNLDAVQSVNVVRS